MAWNIESVIDSPTKVKLVALESSLQQSFCNFKDLATEVERIFVTNESLKSQLSSQTENKRKTCIACEEIKKSLVLTLTRFIETKDWNTLNEAFNILYDETTASSRSEENPVVQYETPLVSSGTLKSPEKRLDSTTEDISFQEESVTEIDGTPTGRTSPIIQPKKTRSATSGLGDKKKCPTNWPTPKKKSLKTTMVTPKRSTPNGKLRQSRLTCVKTKETNVVDLTETPQFSGGIRCSRSRNISNNTLTIIKKEPMNNDDTILPSPTSGSVELSLYKYNIKADQHKFKSLSRQKRTENEENILNNEMEDSVNLLAHSPQKCPLAENINCTNIERTRNLTPEEDCFKIQADQYFNRSPTKTSNIATYGDKTQCQNNDSISLLKHHPMLKHPNKASDVTTDGDKTQCENDDSISLLKHVPISRFDDQNDVGPTVDPDATCCETVADVENNLLPRGQLIRAQNKLEPIYKEPAPRTKAEKRALPGWWCNECKDFWPEIYKNDPEMIKKKMDECSKHRGRHNPVRPNTPEGYWNPRWDVPEDTEAFNRRNNVV